MAITREEFNQLQSGDRVRIVDEYAGYTKCLGRIFWTQFLGDILTINKICDDKEHFYCFESAKDGLSGGLGTMWPMKMITEIVDVQSDFSPECDIKVLFE